MKIVAWVIVALLAGMVLGTWSMKADLRKARKEIAALKKELEQKGGRQTGLEGITSMLKLPAPDRTRQRAPTEAPPPAEAIGATTSTPAAVSTSDWSGFTNRPHHARHRHADTNSVRDQIQAAADVWKVRTDLARNSFVSNVTTSEDQAAQFEVAMVAMNLRLSNSIRTWVDYVKEAQTVTPETGVKIMSDLSATLVWAYNDLDRTMPPNWRAAAGPKFQVFDFIDPQVAMPLVDAEQILRQQDVPVPTDEESETPPAATMSVSFSTSTTNR